MIRLSIALLCLASIAMAAGAAQSESRRSPITTDQTSKPAIGCLANPRRLRSLEITKPGVYENLLIDGRWLDHVLVRIKADGVTLRNCEILNGKTNGVEVYAANVTIENCKIHHMLSQTFKDQHDAHGITGRPNKLAIRNCEIYYVSGDAVQFDPGRKPWDDVLIEGCTFWTGPLPADAAGFKKGERPGENAVDTKQLASNPRSRMTIRDCLFYGWKQPAQINTMAALNLKNNVEVKVERCELRDNEVCFRLRGPGKKENKFGGAKVEISDCKVSNSEVAVRMEDLIENLKIDKLGFGPGIKKKYVNAGGGPGAGYANKSEYSFTTDKQ